MTFSRALLTAALLLHAVAASAPPALAQATKTHLRDRPLDAGGNPPSRKVTFVPTQQPAPGGAGIQDKGGQLFNVRALGAKGDGVTNDRAAIAAALAAALAAGGGTLYFPPGNYFLTPPGAGNEIFLLPRSIKVVGAGRGVTFITTSSNIPVVRLKPAVVEVDNHGFVFEGIRVNNAGAGPCLTLDTSSGVYIAHFRIHDNWFASAGAAAVSVNNSLMDGVFTGSITSNVFTSGLDLSNAGDTINVFDNVFAGASYAIKAPLISAGASTLNIIGNNVTAGQGLILGRGSQLNVAYNIIEMHQPGSRGTDGAAVSVHGAGAGAGALSFVNFSHNVISSLGGNRLNGVHLQQATNVSFRHNQFNQPAGKVGIYIGPGVDRTYISDDNYQVGAGTRDTNTSDPHVTYEVTATVGGFGAANIGNLHMGGLAKFDAGVVLGPVTFAGLSSPTLGQMAVITDSNTAVWGATIAGGGTNKVLAFFNGTVWTVAGR